MNASSIGKFPGTGREELSDSRCQSSTGSNRSGATIRSTSNGTRSTSSSSAIGTSPCRRATGSPISRSSIKTSSTCSRCAISCSPGICRPWRGSRPRSLRNRAGRRSLLILRPRLTCSSPGGEQELPPFTVYENRDAFPRAFVVPRAEPLPERSRVLSALKQSDLRQVVFLEDFEPPAVWQTPREVQGAQRSPPTNPTMSWLRWIATRLATWCCPIPGIRAGLAPGRVSDATLSRRLHLSRGRRTGREAYSPFRFRPHLVPAW